MARIAWMPGDRPEMADLLAVSLAPDPRLTQDYYLVALTMRLQYLVDRAADPEAAADKLAQAMWEAGAYSGTRFPADEAATVLILSNPEFVDKMVMVGAMPPDLRMDATRAKTAAAMALQRDRAEPPERRLSLIAGLMGRAI